MSRSRERPAVNDTVLLWLACAATLVAGAYVAFGLLGAAIDAQTQAIGRVSNTLGADAVILAQRPVLERAARAGADRLRELDLRADRAAIVADFIHTAARIADAQHVNLDGVDERGAAGPPPALAGNIADAPGFESIPLAMTMSGTYGALIATVRALAQAPFGIQIEVSTIERNASSPDAATSRVPLTAHVRVVLRRLTDDRPAAAPNSLPKDVPNARPF